MADVRNFKPQLSSSRMFKYVKGESKDFGDKKVDDKFYNYMTSSYETQDYLNDSEVFGMTAPLIYQLDLLKEDIDDIHSHLSESKYTSKVQKFPVVDVTEEFFVSGLTQLKGNTRIDGPYGEKAKINNYYYHAKYYCQGYTKGNIGLGY